MIEIIKIVRHCENFHNKSLIKKMIFGMEFHIPSDCKFVVVDKLGVVFAFKSRPELKGTWKSKKEEPFPVAIVKYSGDIKDSLIEI